jgi:4-amino-4-deoxy-L-arabinose transferase-like glycosyltransferase
MGEGILLEDHARYASVAKSILATGDWVTMHESPSRSYFNKPPLYFWLTALLFKLTGPVVWSARFWSVAAGMGTVLLVFSLMRRFADEVIALWAGLALALSNDFLRYSSVGRLDAPQVFLMTLFVYGAGCSILGGRRWYALLPGLACGLSMLTKGPPILGLLPLLPLAAWIRWRQPEEEAKTPWGVLALGFLLGAALCLPWYVAVSRANSGFLDHFFGHEMMDRAKGEWLESKSRLHFVKVLVLHGLPWVVFVPFGAMSLMRSAAGKLAAFRWVLAGWVALTLAMAFAPPPHVWAVPGGGASPTGHPCRSGPHRFGP